MEEKKNVSFAFSKTVENKRIKKSVITDGDDKKEDKDFVLSLEDREVQSSKPKEVKKDLVIPLLKKNTWRLGKGDNPSLDALEAEAAEEILKDVAAKNEEWQDRDKATNPNLNIPLLMQNQVPEGYETDERLDVSLRPNEPDEADYDEIPIEHYGLALLRGMGWKEGEGIGKNNKQRVAPVEAVLRPKGMGLGADRRQAQTLNDSKKGGGKSGEDDEEELVLKKGSFCCVQKGTNKDLYGTIEGLDEDNARVMVKLTVSGKIVTLSQYGIKLVSSIEFKKYSKYINKGKVDKYKEKERTDIDKDDRDDRRKRLEEDREEKYRSREKDSRKDSRKDRERHREKHNSSLSKKRRKEESESPEFHVNSSQSSHHRSTNGNSADDHMILWLRSHIRVRIIDKYYKKGRYYKEKVVVVDVPDTDHCVCRTEDGKVLENLSQSMLETVIPKSDSAHVAIVSGKYRGSVAEVLKRDKSKDQALVQFTYRGDTISEVLDYDSICEYVGDMDEDMGY